MFPQLDHLSRAHPQGEDRSKDLTASTLSGKEYREHWVNWLSSVFEGHQTDLVTLTFAPRKWECDSLGPTGPTRSRVERAGSRFAEFLTGAVGRPSFFIVREYGGMNGRAHLHSIVSDLEGSAIRAGESLHAGSEGFVKLSRRTGSPVEYVSKYVSKADGDFWLAGGPLFGASRVLVGLGEFPYRVDGLGNGRYGVDQEAVK